MSSLMVCADTSAAYTESISHLHVADIFGAPLWYSLGLAFEESRVEWD